MTDTVSLRRPPRAVLRMLNPLMRRLATSPLHPLVDRGVMLLHVTGRRTGRRYDIPVGRHEFEGRLLLITDARWRANLRGGADVALTWQGRRRPAHADVVEDAAAVAAVCHRLIERIGVPAARRQFGMVINGNLVPSEAQLTEAVRAYGLAAVLLAENPG